MASAEVVPVQTPGGRGQKPQRSERFLGPKEETGPQTGHETPRAEVGERGEGGCTPEDCSQRLPATLAALTPSVVRSESHLA